MSQTDNSGSGDNPRTVMGALRGFREYMSPTLQKTAFLERGVLTPDEFVQAGDELVFRCPAWSWQGGTKTYLPADKQFLVTRNVPCPTRVADMEAELGLFRDDAGDDEEEDWLVSTKRKPEDLGDDFDILDEEGEVMKPSENKDDEYGDMADFEDENVLADDDVVAAEADDNVLKVRTYDLSITYDKYYQTPRVWMVGKSAEGQPLSGQEMLQDVMADYANKTVTIESHPHVSGPHASIHPCKHGQVMKTIVQNLVQEKEGDGNESAGPSVEMYLFIFLKFVSSIIPTIAYDFTMDVTASTRK